MNIHVSNPKQLKDKLNKFNKNNFHIISDFDKTLTTAFVDGNKIQSTYALIREGKYLSSDYTERSHALLDEYHPYEVSSEIPLDEKKEKMQEWWSKHFALLVECGMNKNVINDIIISKRLRLREGSSKFFEMLRNNNIPILIFSAGVGDIIKEFMESENKLTPNVHLISNFYNFDEHGMVTGVKDNFIHVFNKQEVEVKKTPYYDEIKGKRNIILIGDSLGDLGMSEGLKHNEIIRVGFLNDNKERLMKEYADKFDIVILDDGSMDYVNELLEKILAN